MIKGGGKRKGAEFERNVCKELSLWVTRGRRDDVFWRSAMSGGRATLAQQKGIDRSRVAGDICAVSKEGYKLVNRYFIECKFVRDLRLASFLFASEGALQQFWLKCLKQSKDHKRTPMLVARQNGMPALLITVPGQLSTVVVDADLPCMMNIGKDAYKWPASVYLFHEVVSSRYRP